MRILTLALILVTITCLFSSASAALQLSLPGTTCEDPQFDSCTLAFYIPRTDVDTPRDATISINAAAWLAPIQSIQSSHGECSLSSDRRSIELHPQLVPTSYVYECIVYMSPDGSVRQTPADNYQHIILPAMAYYQYPIEFTPLSSPCSNPSSSDVCEANLQFPIVMLPFELRTYSPLALDALECFDANDPSSIIDLGPSTMEITPRGDVAIDQLNVYDFVIKSPTFAATHSLITCSGAYTKSVVPFFRIHDRTGAVLFENHLIVHSDLTAFVTDDCLDPKQNRCTMIFRFSDKIPHFDDLHTEARGFKEVLSPVAPCPLEFIPSHIAGPSFQFACQSFRKGLTTSTLSSVSDNTVSFFGEYFNGVVAIFPAETIVYTTPLEWTFDEVKCKGQWFECPLTVKSRHTGSPVVIYFEVPYSGIIANYECNSSFINYNLRQRNIRIGGGPAGTVPAPHPDDFFGKVDAAWSCTLWISKVPFGVESIAARPYQINLYRETLPQFSTIELHPDSTLFSFPSDPYKEVPLKTEAMSNCSDKLQQKCTITFSPANDPDRDYPRSFTFSPAGIRIGLLDSDWSWKIADPEQNGDSTLDITVSQLNWQFPKNLDPSKLDPQVTYATTCNPGTGPRCRPAPSPITENCIPPCDYTKPNDPENPCTMCQENIWLFNVQISGIVKSPWSVTFIKEAWTVSYKNLKFCYSYGGVQYSQGHRFGTGDVAPRLDDNGIETIDTLNQQIVVAFHPQAAVSYADCNDPTSYSCILGLSRRDTAVRSLYFDIDETNFLTVHNLPTQKVWNDTSRAYQTVQYTPIPAVLAGLDIFMPFNKRVGVNTVFEVKVHHVETRNVPDPVTGIVAAQLYFSDETDVYHDDLIFTSDGHPTFDSNCGAISSPICTISYTFHSWVTMLSRLSVPIPSTPVEVIKHYVPSEEFIQKFEFSPDTTKPVYGTVRFSGSSERDYTDLPFTRPVTCIGDKMDLETTFDFVYEPAVTTAGTRTLGTFALRLISGETPRGAQCIVTLHKKPAAHESRKLREVIINQYGQYSQDWIGSPDNYILRFPSLQFNKASIVPFPDCTTQQGANRVLECTVQIISYASNDHTLSALRAVLPMNFQHPFFMLEEGGDSKLAVYEDLASLDLADSDTATPRPLVAMIDVAIVQNDKGEDEKIMTFTVEPKYRNVVVSGYTRFYSQPTGAVPFSAIPLPLHYSGDDPTAFSDSPIVATFPPALMGTLFVVGTNATSVDGSAPIVTIDFRFKAEGITKIVIDQDFTFSTRLIKNAQDEINAATPIEEGEQLPPLPTEPNSITNPSKIPCYMKRSETTWVSIGQFAQHFQTTDSSAEIQHEIGAWLEYDPKTKLSTLTPIDPAVMKDQSCYIFYQITGLTKITATHTITATTVTGSALDVTYQGVYPRYVQSSRILPWDYKIVSYG